MRSRFRHSPVIMNKISNGGLRIPYWTTPRILTDGVGKFRKGVREGVFVIDKTLTVIGFTGIENTDWENIIQLQ